MTTTVTRVPVTLHSAPLRVPDPVACTVALRDRLGRDQVFLFESLAGPDADTRVSVVGVTGLLEITVRRSLVAVTGVPEVVDLVRNALLDAGDVVDREGLRLVSDDALWQLPRTVDGLFDVERDPGRFGLGLLAFYGYDAVRYVERLPRTIADRPADDPDAVFSLVHAAITIDPATGSATCVSADSPLWPSLAPSELIAVAEGASALDDTQAPEVPEPSGIHREAPRDEYLRRAERCLEHIRLGDIYQVQLGHEITVTSDADEMTVYRRLRWRNPSPYMSLLPVAGRFVVGASPELFVRLEDGAATMRPIAGTTRRVHDPRVDREAAKALLADPKERAEHVMLVDLCRNDLGRIAQPTSVEVTEMMTIEAYSHMFHIVSDVTSRTQPGVDVHDVVRACFPAGTMTGAPKVRAMEIIEDLEWSRRGLYAGAFGLVGFGGWSVLGLAIRMTVRDGDAFSLRASAGIVADSDPEREWEETLTKMGATFWAVTGREIR